MLRELLNAHNRGRSVAELTALAAELVAENDRLRLEVAKLQKENRYLRRVLGDKELRTLRRAEVDAAMLGLLWFAGAPTSRAACVDAGISRRRWAWARALLQAADLLHGGRMTVTEMGAFDQLLAAGVERVESEGLRVLTVRLPRNGTAGRKFGRPVGHANSHAHGHALRAKRDRFSGH